MPKMLGSFVLCDRGKGALGRRCRRCGEILDSVAQVLAHVRWHEAADRNETNREKRCLRVYARHADVRNAVRAVIAGARARYAMEVEA